MFDDVESITWLTEPYLEFCSHRTQQQLYPAINQAGRRNRDQRRRPLRGISYADELP